MKILHVITSLKTGGAERLMVDLLVRLRDLDNDVELLVFDGIRTSFYEQLEQKGITIHSFGKGGNVYNPLNIIKLKTFLGRYDIIHTHNTACQLFTAIASLLIKNYSKLVTTEHSTSNRRRSWWWYAMIDRWMYRQYSKIICISDKVENNLRLSLSKKRSKNIWSSICTIYNGIDVNSFNSASPAKDILENFKDKKTILMVSGFRYQKDHATLIRSISLLPGNYVLLLIGKGERENESIELVEELNLKERVFFIGLRNDIQNVLKSVTCVVQSSHIEGFGLAAVEAMAASVPVIASDVDGLREVVKDAGILFPHGNYKALADEIRQLCENPDRYSQIAKRCQERAKQFDISIMAENYNELYKSL